MTTTNGQILERWLAHVCAALDENPRDTLRRFLYPSHSRTNSKAWNPVIDAVCKRPKGGQQHYYRMEVRAILLIALENQLRHLEAASYRGAWSAWQADELADALQIVRHLDGHGVSVMCGAKMRLNRICRKMGVTLHALYDPLFVTYIDHIANVKW